MCTRDIEIELAAQGHHCVIGIDEVGAGTLCGPVTICACYIPLNVDIPGIKDSKQLSPNRRELLFNKLTTNPDVKYDIVHIDNNEIDRINILQARLRGFYESFCQLQARLTSESTESTVADNSAVNSSITPIISMVLIDGNIKPPQFAQSPLSQVKTIVKGDCKVTCIGAASIIAKVTRDRMMIEYDKQYPGYELSKNMGYYSTAHIDALKRIGPSPIHRRTFRGVVQKGFEFL
jgi:ribonuclease HII